MQEVNQQSSFFGNNMKKPTYIAVIGGITGFIALALCVIASVLYCCTGGVIPFDHGIIIDAGSSHTTTYLYRWLGDKDNGTGDVLQEQSCSYPGGIATSLDPTQPATCVTNVTQSLEKMLLPSIPLYLGATAGMRLLNMTQPKLSNMILLALRYALKLTGVDVKSVQIITGYEEGLFSWISVNFLLDSFSLKTFYWPFSKRTLPWKNTIGALDMGGASTQIAFAVDPSTIKNDSSTLRVKLYGHQYTVVSETFLCFGMVEAFNRRQALLIKELNSSANIIDPCLPEGNFSHSNAELLLGGPCTLTPIFGNWLELENNSQKVFTFEGKSDFEACQKSIDNLLDSSYCEARQFAICPTKFNISMTSRKFMAFSSFYYMASFLNSTNVSLPVFLTNTENWCKLTWDEIKHHEYKKSDLSHLTQYCFGALYIVKWLRSIYNFNESSWDDITFQQQIDGSDVGWTLGYMINATNAIPEELPTLSAISTGIFITLIVTALLFLMIGIFFFRRYCKIKSCYSDLNYERLGASYT